MSDYKFREFDSLFNNSDDMLHAVGIFNHMQVNMLEDNLAENKEQCFTDDHFRFTLNENDNLFYPNVDMNNFNCDEIEVIGEIEPSMNVSEYGEDAEDLSNNQEHTSPINTYDKVYTVDENLEHSELKGKVKEQASIKKNIMTNCTTYYENTDEEKADYINSFLFDLDFRKHVIDRFYNKSSKRGRPRNQVSRDSQCIIQKIVSELNQKKNNDQRIDASHTTIGRALMKIPNHILKQLIARAKCKTSDIDVTIDAYLISFTEGFVKAFEISEDKVSIELFVSLILLWLPEEKVKKIISILSCAKLLQFEEDYYVNQLKNCRAKHTLEWYQELYKDNSSFKLILEYHTVFSNALSKQVLTKFKAFEEAVKYN